MASFQYDPGIAYRGDQYTAQAGQALASDISNMFAQHHAQKLQDQLDQANAAKAKVTMDFLAKQNGASLEDMAAFHDAAANGNYTKATKIAEGAAANFATSIALQHQAAQQPKYQYFQPPQGAPPGTPGVGALTAGASVHPIIPQPSEQPLGVQQVPVPGGGTVNVLHGGGVQTQVIKDANGKPKLELTDQDIANGQKAHHIPLRQSDGSYFWVKDPSYFPATKEAPDSLTQFAKDVTAAQTVLPNLDSKQSELLGQAFVDRLKGLTSKTQGAGDKAVQDQSILHVKSVDEAMALPPGTPFYDTEGKLRTR